MWLRRWGSLKEALLLHFALRSCKFLETRGPHTVHELALLQVFEGTHVWLAAAEPPELSIQAERTSVKHGSLPPQIQRGCVLLEWVERIFGVEFTSQGSWCCLWLWRGKLLTVSFQTATATCFPVFTLHWKTTAQHSSNGNKVTSMCLAYYPTNPRGGDLKEPTV